MDTTRVLLDNEIYHTEFKVKAKHRFLNSVEGLDRAKFADKLIKDWWNRTGRWKSLISTLLFDPFIYFCEATECYRSGLFLGCAVLCRASIDSAMYATIQQKAWFKVMHDQHKQGDPNKVIFYDIDNPQIVRMVNKEIGKKGNLSRKELFAAGEKLGVLDHTITKKIEAAMETGDIIMHYDESFHKMLSTAKQELRATGKSSAKSVERFYKHVRPLLDNKKTKNLLSQTADILEYLATKADKYTNFDQLQAASST